MSRDELPSFLSVLAREVLALDRSNVPRKRISKRLDLKAQPKVVKPKRPSSDHPIEERAEWMAHFIRATVPELEIWQRAFGKADGREKELIPPLSPLICRSSGRLLLYTCPLAPSLDCPRRYGSPRA